MMDENGGPSVWYISLLRIILMTAWWHSFWWRNNKNITFIKVINALIKLKLNW